MILALLAWAMCLAQAHPFGARFAAHSLVLEVDEDEVRVDYLADVPNPLVASATQDPQADVLEAMATELLSGLVLEVDGRTVPLEPTGPWSTRPTEDTQQFAWSLSAPLARVPARIEVSNGNLPEVTAVFRSRVEVGDDLVLAENSLWRMSKGEIALDETDRWRTHERMRALEVRVVRPTPTWPFWVSGGVGLVLLGAAAWRLRTRTA